MAFGSGMLVLPESVSAGNMFNNMMNPSKWFGSKNNRYDDYYDDGYYGGPPPGYGYGAPGYGYGAPGYGAPGYGAPAYGAPAYGAPTYAAPAAPAAVAPAPAPVDNSAERIKALEDRIRQLEASQKAAPPAYGGNPYPQQAPAPYQAPSGGGSYAPPPGSAFRPTN